MASISSQHDLIQDGKEAPPWATHTHQPHWRNGEDEVDAAKMGMWLFLSTEILLFSGMFCAYIVFRMLYPEAFHHASHYYLSWQIGAINTGVLLLSSYTVVMAIRSAQLNKQFWLKVNLLVTIACGIFFLATKIGLEYMPKIAKGELPGAGFTYPNAENAYEPIFMSVYWVATAIHGSHVLVGVLLLGWCLWKSTKLHYGPKHITSLENVGLFWHLVDVIWIFLFPMLYLVG